MLTYGLSDSVCQVTNTWLSCSEEAAFSICKYVLRALHPEGVHYKPATGAWLGRQPQTDTGSHVFKDTVLGFGGHGHAPVELRTLLGSGTLKASLLRDWLQTGS